MKKIIMLLGYLFLGLLITIVMAVAGVYLLGKRFDRESRAYVDAAIPAIVSKWDVRELQKRVSPDFDESVDYDEIGQYFDDLRALGSMVAYKGAVGDSLITVSFRYLYEITADYSAIVDFEAGSTEIQITLIKRGGRWQILDFRVNPEEFSNRSDVI